MSKFKHVSPARTVASSLALVLICFLATGCQPADKSSASSDTSTTAGTNAMAGMAMAGGSGSGMSSRAMKNIKPVPTQMLGTADWQGMKITAKAMTAVPFIVYNGTKEHTVEPGPNASFHLMIFLADAQTNAVIPYASVWATISQGGKTFFDDRLWPMISRYMGPHYGDDVSLPGAGTYQMSLLISPPVSARHMEYQNVWLSPHRVEFSFHWKAT